MTADPSIWRELLGEHSALQPLRENWEERGRYSVSIMHISLYSMAGHV